jgi:histidine triad (HIT) family protein
MAGSNMQQSPKLKDDCGFCRILQGKAQCLRVMENRSTLTFLDDRPLFPGHCLLIPKRHIETLFDLPDSLIKPIFANVRLLAKAVQEAMEADGSLVIINNRVSQSVPHLHVHIVPRRKGDGLKGFLWPRRLYAGAEEIDQVLLRLHSTIARLQRTEKHSRNSKQGNG